MYLMQVLHDTQAFQRKCRPEEIIKPESFPARFDAEWPVVEEHGRPRSQWMLRSVEETGGNSARPVRLYSSSCPFVFRDEDAPFLQVQTGSGQVKQQTAKL